MTEPNEFCHKCDKPVYIEFPTQQVMMSGKWVCPECGGTDFEFFDPLARHLWHQLDLARTELRVLKDGKP